MNRFDKLELMVRLSTKSVRIVTASFLMVPSLFLAQSSAQAANELPTVTSVSPNAGSTSGGRSVTLTGTNFVDVSAVKFGSAYATDIVVNSSTSITLNTPPNSSGLQSIQVFTMSGESNLNISYEYFSPAFYAFDNGFLRFGTGNQSSFATNGVLEQPWYKYNGNYGKLTISDNALYMSLGSGNSGANWTGSAVMDVTSPLANFQVDSSGFVGTGKSVSGAGEVGFGTVETSGNFTLNGSLLKLQTRYFLGKGKSYIEVTSKVTNLSSSNVSNLNFWVGTRDDWIGASNDTPRKERGNVANGTFSQVANSGAVSNALRVSSSSEGALFFSTSPGANTSVSNCCSFSNAYNTPPTSSPTDITHDGSYAMNLSASQVAPNGSIELTWYYAAGAITALNSIANQIYVASTAPSAPQIDSTSVGTNYVDVTFTEPSSTGGGGATITNYEYSIDGGANWVTRNPVGIGSPLRISGLTDETTYRLQLRAVNSVPLSGAASSVTQITTAGQPPELTVTPSTTFPGSANFTFTISGSEVITGLSLSDLTITGSGCQLSNLTGTGRNYSVTVFGCANGSTAVLGIQAYSVSDLAGNLGPLTAISSTGIQIDTTIPSNVTIPELSGSSAVGGTLNVSQGSWTASNLTYAYEWQSSDSVNGTFTAINGQTSPSLSVGQSLLGKFLRAKVTVQNVNGSSTEFSLVSARVAQVPINTTLPVITGYSGNPVVGDELQVSNGSWTGQVDDIDFQWFRKDPLDQNWSLIPGETNSFYVLTSGDVEKIIRAKVIAKNSDGETQVFTSSSGAVTKASQVISGFSSPGNKLFNLQEISVSAMASSGLPVSFISNTPSVCAPGNPSDQNPATNIRFEFKGIGTCSISASQLGDAGYQAASPVTRSFEIQLDTPSVVRNVTTSVLSSKIKMNWSAPQTTGGSPISNYLVTATAGGTSFTCSTTTTTCEIEGLTAGTSYEVTIVATNTAVGASSAKSSAATTPVRASIPASTSSTTSGSVPTQVAPRPVTSLLGNVNASNQTALINSGVIAPPPSVPVINVAADLSAGSISTPTTVVVSQTIESGAQIDLAIKPPTDTPVGTAVFGTLILADGTTFDLGQIGITSDHLTNGFSLSPFTILPVGKHFIELRFGETTVAPAVYAASSFRFAPLAEAAPAYKTLSTGSQINVKFEINIVAGPNGVPTIQKPAPTASPTPTRSATPTPTPSESETVLAEEAPTPEPTVEAAAEPEVVVDARGLEVTNPLTDAPLAVAETTLTAVALVAAVSAAGAAAAAAGAAAGAASAGAASGGGAARAGSGASGGGSGSGGSGSGSSGGSGGDSNSEGEDDASIEGVDFEHEGFEVDAKAWGDSLKVWSIPVLAALDEPSHKATEKLAPITPLVSKLISDAAYLKAMLGSISLLFPILGVFLGLHGISESGGQLLPPTAPIITAIAVIGVLDAFAGFIAMAIYTTGMILTAGVHNAADLRMLLGLVIIGFGPSLLASAFRGLRKQAEDGHHYWWERLTDLAVAPFLGGWATKGMVEALTPLAGVELPIHDHANAIAISVAIALMVRILLEEFSARFFPSRLNFIHPTDVPSPTNMQKIIALTLRAAVFFFVAGAFIGNSWHLYVGTFLFIAPSYLALYQDRFPNYPRLYQILPAGLPGLAFTLLVASGSLSALTAVLGETPELAQIAFVVLPIPSVILSILGMFGREPAEGDVRWYQRAHLTWLYRIGGIVMLVYTMRLTGII